MGYEGVDCTRIFMGFLYAIQLACQGEVPSHDRSFKSTHPEILARQQVRLGAFKGIWRTRMRGDFYCAHLG